VRAEGSGPRGTVARASGRVGTAADTTRVRLDTLTVVTDASRWLLAAPAHLVRTPDELALDSLVLRAGRDTLVRVAGASPREGGRTIRITARGFPLADAAELLQLADSMEGTLDLDAELRGTRDRPELEGQGMLRGALVRGLRLDTLRFTGSSAADQLRVTAQLGAAREPLVTADATLPLRLGGAGTLTEWIPGGPLRGRLRSDSLPFRVFEHFTRGANGNGRRPAPGTLAFDVTLGGTWARPTLDGRLRARDGTLNVPEFGDVRWRNVRADVAFRGDSIVIDSVSASSSEEGRTGRATLTGWLSLRDREDPRLDLRLESRAFHAIARPGVADVDISGTLHLDGSWRDARLRGDLTADRAVIAIPTLTGKDVISLEDPDRFGVVDTLVMLDERRLRVGPPTLVENLTVENVPVRMGREVWLRSSEANVNLGGAVNITRGRVTRGREAGQYQLALDGSLQTVRGTYRLNLGPVQRTFEVQSGGMRFFGDPDLNPTLDITGSTRCGSTTSRWRAPTCACTCTSAAPCSPPRRSSTRRTRCA
jgi:translocation and assembly module TamB